ncbi:hypothetical protein GGTG_04511 [Gaeumannomyces tritici R3-111a-1]|uniref:Uncharacterized protein n=1 Tax=Gaeumannomyces tritici (strain R3-111a-1) TaxID=644352 RepID=J3NTB2_GAET3|nr:hypothetical protein GGTG_04511 [Gaeumannomyces tritici R3-111a-1]EJT79427.1 hypothetical protein GGTG_04511 [Gaeumannomyces tritici R3-111a-1]
MEQNPSKVDKRQLTVPLVCRFSFNVFSLARPVTVQRRKCFVGSVSATWFKKLADGASLRVNSPPSPLWTASGTRVGAAAARAPYWQAQNRGSTWGYA